MIEYNKPFKTYAEQASYLSENYSLVINDNDFAIHALKTVSYYDLINGYKECMMVDNHFKDNVSIEFLYMFYLFDKGFQNILFKQLMFVENHFKTVLSYTLSKNFGVHVDDYLSKTNYVTNQKNLYFSTVKTNIEKIYRADIDRIPQPTQHYAKNHNHIPPWILLKNISFSNSINLFHLLKSKEKGEIANTLIPESIPYKNKMQFIINALNLLRKFRNQIAHNLKFVTYEDPDDKLIPSIAMKLLPPTLIFWKDIKIHACNLNDIYTVLLLIIYFLKDKYLINLFCNEILSFIQPINKSTNGEVQASIFKEYATITNIPYNLPARLMNYKKTLI